MSKTSTRTIASVASAALLGASMLVAAPAGAEGVYSGTGSTYHRHVYGHRLVPAIGNGFVNFVNKMLAVTVAHPRTYGHAYVAGDPYSRDAAWCSAHYRSYTPASGTFTGYDRMQHHCP